MSRTSYGFKRFYEDLDAQSAVEHRHGWTAQDMADHFDALDEHTVGMSHPERLAWLANELSLHGDDEHLTKSKSVAWNILCAWEAARTSILSRVAADPNVSPAFKDALFGREEDALLNAALFMTAEDEHV